MEGAGGTTLNDAQRLAAEFGTAGDGPPRALLAIAGAGTGKTATRDQTGWPDESESDAPPQSDAGVRIDFGAKLRALW